MFVQNLNTKQQELLLAASYKLIAADGILDDRETQMVNILKSQCEESVQVEKDFQLAEIKNNFSKNKEKASFMLELIAIALADEDYAEEEKQLLKEISKEMEILEPFLEDMVTWVKTQMNLSKQATLFMED